MAWWLQLGRRSKSAGTGQNCCLKAVHPAMQNKSTAEAELCGLWHYMGVICLCQAIAKLQGLKKCWCCCHQKNVQSHSCSLHWVPWTWQDLAVYLATQTFQPTLHHLAFPLLQYCSSGHDVPLTDWAGSMWKSWSVTKPRFCHKMMPVLKKCET